MSAVKLESESVLSQVVEGMLPRFSDSKLGLLIGVDLHVYDLGYGKDGNTLERKEKNVRQYLYFLFVRSSNYTKVLFWEPKKGAKGLDCFPKYSNETGEWYLLSDHDSCWRDAMGSKLTDAYYHAQEQFEGRMKSGEKLTNQDLSEYITLNDAPLYRYLEVCEQKDKKADRFSTEGRTWLVKMKPITISKLEMLESPDKEWMGDSGLLIKGGEDHQRYVKMANMKKPLTDSNHNDSV